MKKFISFFIIISISLGLFITVHAVTSGADEVTIVNPEENGQVGSVFPIEFIIVDDDSNNPSYFIDLFHLGCTEGGSNIGKIALTGAQKEGNSYTYNWDTSNNIGNYELEDGKQYCLRVCAILQSEAGAYSLCDKRSIQYSKDLVLPPRIISTPVDDTVKVNQVFVYQVEVHNPSDSNITYQVTDTPNFVQIDQTGKLTAQPSESGSFAVKVEIQDDQGNKDSQEFTLKVVSDQELEATIDFPGPGDTLSTGNSKIRWSVNDNVNVEKIVISYSPDQKEWTKITELDSNPGEYEWDISNVEDGSYFLSMDVTSENNVFQAFTGPFNIVKDTENPNTVIFEELTPEAESTININNPQISFKYTSPDGVVITKESIVVKVDDRIDLLVCETDTNPVTCNLISNLPTGAHKVSVIMEDEADVSYGTEWSFNVSDQIIEPTDDPENVDENGGLSIVQVLIAITAVGFVLIAIPWTIFMLIRRRKKSKKKETDLPSSIDATPIVPPSPLTDQQQFVTGQQIQSPQIGEQGIQSSPGTQEIIMPGPIPMEPGKTVPTQNAATTSIPPQQMINTAENLGASSSVQPVSFDSSELQTQNVPQQESVQLPSPRASVAAVGTAAAVTKELEKEIQSPPTSKEDNLPPVAPTTSVEIPNTSVATPASASTPAPISPTVPLAQAPTTAPVPPPPSPSSKMVNTPPVVKEVPQMSADLSNENPTIGEHSIGKSNVSQQSSIPAPSIDKPTVPPVIPAAPQDSTFGNQELSGMNQPTTNQKVTPQTSQTPPTVTENLPVENNTKKTSSIGVQDLLEEEREPEMPSVYQSDEIPDWLKDTDTKKKDKPKTDPNVISKGEVLEGSRVHDPFGIALNDDEGMD